MTTIRTTTPETTDRTAAATTPAARTAQAAPHAETSPAAPPVVADLGEVEAVSVRYLGMLNDAAAVILVSLGHRTGLFDAMAAKPPTTSERIAADAGLDERYVREWLRGMTTARLVTYDPTDETYALPPVQAATLTRAAAPDNLAVFSQFIPLMGGVQDGIVNCFRNGGGLPHPAFPRFHHVMAEDSLQSVVAVLETEILEMVPGLGEGLAEGLDVLDVGCGRGLAMMKLAERFPRCRVVGYDYSTEAIEWARAEAKRRGLTNVRFQVVDAAAFDDRDAFDLITTFDAIHDQANPTALLANLRRALREGGVYLAMDIDTHTDPAANVGHPLGTLLYSISLCHCMTVSLADGGPGLGTCWGREKALEMFAEAGFGPVRIETREGDVQNCFYIMSK